MQTPGPNLSLELANLVLEVAIEQARAQGTPMNIAVVDSGARLKVFIRMDGARLGCIDVAIKKACTACFFEMESGTLGELSRPGGSLYNIELSNGGLITFPGGIPIKSPDGEIIGAIGVSGSTVENDRAVAFAGASLSCPIKA